MEKLTYITNEEIADLFTTLLSKAASEETVNQAHPSFIQLIDRLSVDEARIIKYLKNEAYLPYVTFKGHSNEEDYMTILNKGTLLPFNLSLEFPQNTIAYQDNLLSMGVLSYSEGFYLANESVYETLYEKYELEKLRRIHVKENSRFGKIEPSRGSFEITNFGKLFIQACTL